ncbi:hypothetical protein QCA50_020312 [Cerrena zonata]|uniref:Uncharacterized protein n=1 Tax=Cerrena zonata TaxID=2478898 RepID=A0AAW0F9D5_9APHY
MEDFESHVRAVFPAICVANGVFERFAELYSFLLLPLEPLSDDTIGEIESMTWRIAIPLRRSLAYPPDSQISISSRRSLPPDETSESIHHDAPMLSSSAT